MATAASIRKSQSSVKANLTTIDKDLKSQNGAKISMVKYNHILGNLKRYGEAIEKHHADIYPLLADATEEAAQDVEYDFLHNRFLQVREDLELLKPDAPTPTPNPVACTNTLKLPKFEIPKFNGDMIGWNSFYDLFKASVDSHPGYSGAQKLSVLKASLGDEAARIISNLQITDVNYNEAMKLLKDRYDNKREIINSHLKRLFSQPALKEENAANLRKMIDVVRESVQALKVLGQPVDQWDSMLVFLICEKLDTESRRQWVLSLTSTDVPTFDSFITFLDKRERAIAESGTVKTKSFTPVEKKVHSHLSASSPNTSDMRCRLCSDSHFTHKCPVLLKLSIAERRSLVQKKNLCFNCLSNGHRIASCPSKKTCKKCQEKHHTLLHKEEARSASNDSGSSNASGASGTVSSHHVSLSTNVQLHTVLPTAVVWVRDRRGRNCSVRALIDSGSEVSLVSSACVRRLGLPTKPAMLTINGVAATKVGSSEASASFVVTSRIHNFSTTVEAFVLTRVSDRLPSVTINKSNLSHLHGLHLADPFYYKPEEIDLLLGSDVYASLLRPTPVIIGPSGMPSAFDTVFGWVVSGPANERKPTTLTSHHVHCQLESIVQRFWEVESIPTEFASGPEDMQCEKHFLETKERSASGRYVLRIPLKSSPGELGSSRETAILRLKQVERRLLHKPHLREEYIKFMREYQELGHMERIPVANISPSGITSPEGIVSPSAVYYMPHHCVLKDSSTTTKLRVVFDASCKTSSGKSLNDIMMIGPKTQNDLVAHLLRFRMWTIGICADAKQMYRQFLIHPSDRDLQRIVWRESPDLPIEDWRMTTVTYGTAAAPYLATRALLQLAQDEQHHFPFAAEVTQRDTYVDDLMTGCDSVDDALKLQGELLRMFECGGLELRKWASNSVTLLESIPENLRETKIPFSLDQDDVIKTLGLHWHPANDHFGFSVSAPSSRVTDTKRTFLSDISKVFDPLGWLSPITIKVKCMFQSLWLSDVGWDDVLPEKVQLEWEKYRSELPCITSLVIPRHILLTGTIKIDLLGFCDASIKAYAAAVYVKSTDDAGNTEVHLLTAKTRVAPTKGESLPRLELCGAKLLATLMDSVRKCIVKPVNQVLLWTDSTIVLHWLASPSSRWSCFVGNRVSVIQQSYPRKFWHHVRSQDNPADVASRGILPSDLKDDDLWWHGPVWLNSETYNFSEEPAVVVENPHFEERKVSSHHTTASPSADGTSPSADGTYPRVDSTSPAPRISSPVASTPPVSDTEQGPIDYLIEHFSSLDKLVRVASYCLRFVKNCKLGTGKRIIGPLSVCELRDGLIMCISCVQRASFSREIAFCSGTMRLLPSINQVIRLSPFLKDGVLRVGGRLRKSNLNEDQKFPILLPRDGHFTRLIITDAHVKNLHAGPLLLHATLRQKYWIISGRSVIRYVVHNCLKCFRQRADSAQQKMGDLPSSRVVPSPPFQKTGVDFCGPFLLRRIIGGRSNQTFKAYISVFVCFTTLAYHLEVVSDLSTASFIACLKRFISRRGICSDVFSDNGKNFVGADGELQRFWRAANSSDMVHRFLSSVNVTWHFNPPSAPHQGGLWESSVRAVKGHLKRVIGTQSLNYEEMATLLAQVEACLNSRPLSPLSSDPTDLSAITPGHFLIGRPLNCLAEPDLADIKTNRLSRWQLLQQMMQHFWNRWRNEYLTNLQNRYKWTTTSENVKVGTLVLVKEDNTSPTYWKLGRILLLHPGSDGLVRVVTLRTETGELKRPIVKLCPLPPELNNGPSMSG